MNCSRTDCVWSFPRHACLPRRRLAKLGLKNSPPRGQAELFSGPAPSELPWDTALPQGTGRNGAEEYSPEGVANIPSAGREPIAASGRGALARRSDAGRVSGAVRVQATGATSHHAGASRCLPPAPMPSGCGWCWPAGASAGARPLEGVPGPAPESTVTGGPGSGSSKVPEPITWPVSILRSYSAPGEGRLGTGGRLHARPPRGRHVFGHAAEISSLSTSKAKLR